MGNCAKIKKNRFDCFKILLSKKSPRKNTDLVHPTRLGTKFEMKFNGNEQCSIKSKANHITTALAFKSSLYGAMASVYI